MNNDTASPANFLSAGSASVWVACGGILGALSRHGVDVLFMPVHGLHPGFPWTTFGINVVGSALLGFITAWGEESTTAPRWLRPFGGIGFCGAFTTFSTASVEILLLARDGQATLALGYIAASLVCGILAVTLATALAVRMFKNPRSAKKP